MNRHELRERFAFNKGVAPRWMLALNIVMAFVYFIIIAFLFTPGNPVLFGLLIAGEVFHLWQSVGYAYTVWNMNHQRRFDPAFAQGVDVYITVCGEPVEIIEETARAALAMDYPAQNFSVYILNDGFVANKDNWQEVEDMAKRLGIGCITRRTPGGAKAGNINNAMRQTNNPFVVVFDADHVPKPVFLRKVMGYFTDPLMGFVQTPQFYNNQHESTVAQTAWDQQALFFGPIMRGKNRLDAAFMCGTNMAIRRAAIDQAGGMCETSIAEDFLTSLFIHEKGWKSHYVHEVLAEGLAPEDFLSYYKQQFRWTRGSLEVVLRHNPLFMKGMKFGQKMQYLLSSGYYLTGLVVLIDALLPIIFFFTGLTAIKTSTMWLAIVFLPYIALTLAMLQRSSNFTYTFHALSFSISSFYLQVHAFISALLGKKVSFAVTSKTAIQGNFLKFAIPHLAYIALAIGGMVFAYLREGFSAALAANASWAIVNIVTFLPFIAAAAPTNVMNSIRKKFHVKSHEQRECEEYMPASAMQNEGAN